MNISSFSIIDDYSYAPSNCCLVIDVVFKLIT